MPEKEQYKTTEGTIRRKAEFKKFIEFIALPKVLRKREFGSGTQKGFAEKYELEESTLSHWKDRDGFWDKVKQKRKEWGKERTPEVLVGLYRRAKREGRGSDVKVWMEVMEDWKQEEKYDIHSEEMGELAEAIKKLASNE